jgi:hypothetical protein
VHNVKGEVEVFQNALIRVAVCDFGMSLKSKQGQIELEAVRSFSDEDARALLCAVAERLRLEVKISGTGPSMAVGVSKDGNRIFSMVVTWFQQFSVLVIGFV